MGSRSQGDPISLDGMQRRRDLLGGPIMIGKKPKSNPLAGQLVDLEGSPLASWLTG